MISFHLVTLQQCVECSGNQTSDYLCGRWPVLNSFHKQNEHMIVYSGRKLLRSQQGCALVHYSALVSQLNLHKCVYS